MKTIAHRGYSKKNPENTIASFKEAVKIGADAIELDIHITLDEKIIVFHNYNLESTSNGKGLIYLQKYNYIKTLDAGSWFDSSFKLEKIPQLEEVFNIFGNCIEYEIELKGFSKRFIDITLELINKYKLLNQTEFTSPHLHNLLYLRKINKKTKIGYIPQEKPDWMENELHQEIILNNLKFFNFDVLHLPMPLLSRNYIKKLHALGFKIHVANCDNINDIKLAYDYSADQFSTNDLENAIQLKKKHESNE